MVLVDSSMLLMTYSSAQQFLMDFLSLCHIGKLFCHNQYSVKYDSFYKLINYFDIIELDFEISILAISILLNWGISIVIPQSNYSSPSSKHLVAIRVIYTINKTVNIIYITRFIINLELHELIIIHEHLN